MRASPGSAIPLPPRGVVQRPRLSAMLEAGTRGPLTLVAAPSGTGKTVLVSSWARARAGSPGRAVRWVCVEAADAVEDVWHEMLEVLDPAGDVPGALRGSSDMSRQVLDRVAASLDAQPDPVVLVLDCDATLAPEIASALDRLLRRCGDRLHVVVVARTDPPMALHRYRLDGTVTEVRTSDLAFTRSEAGEMLAAAGLDLSPADVDTLTARTQGWAAGLRLASLAIAPRADQARAVRDLRGDTGMVAEYLVAEMLDQQPSEVRGALLRTSVVDVVRPGLAEALAGPRATRTLAAMKHANILVEELDEHSGWYRYHPLFRELLRAQHAYEAPDEHRSVHQAAAAWYVEHGYVEDAVRHAAAVQDWASATNLVVGSLSAGRLLVDRTPTLSTLLADLPPDVAGPAPALVRACLDLREGSGPHGSVVSPLTPAEAAAWPEGQLTAMLLTLLSASTLSGPAMAGPTLPDPDDVLSAAATADELLAAQPAHRLEEHPEARTIVRAGEGAGWVLRGDLDRAATAFATGASEHREEGRELPVIRCLAHLALVVAVRSELRRAAALADQALTLCKDAGARGGAEEGAAELALAWVRTETFELDAAQRHLVRARSCGTQAPGPLVTFVRALVTARLSRAHGDSSGARDALREAIDRTATLPAWMQDLLRRETSAAPGGGENVSEGQTVRTLAVRVEVLLVEAADHLAGGETARARRVVARALDLAALEDLRRPFREAPREVRQLLRLDHALLAAHGWLVGGDRGEPGLSASMSDASPGTSGARKTTVLVPLTVKELEVLVHLDALARTEDIAGAMFITVNTVRTHIRHILQKLDATRRNEAVRRARELGLIPPARALTSSRRA